MTRFRPCIDLHEGRVKQVVGGTFDRSEGPATNFVADHDAAWFAERYRADGAEGGHLIKLGPGNDEAARSALAAWPGGLQIGGGITADNASDWLAAGASHVIVTSWLFPDGTFAPDRLAALAAAVGADHLVVDVSCRRADEGWVVAIDRWTRRTDTVLNEDLFDRVAGCSAEVLVHAADVEGLCRGIDGDLVAALAAWCGPRGLACTYAGGAASLDDLDLVRSLSGGAVDLTIGSALDLFGGSVPYEDCLRWNVDHPE